jgi:hypothetical protein
VLLAGLSVECAALRQGRAPYLITFIVAPLTVLLAGLSVECAALRLLFFFFFFWLNQALWQMASGVDTRAFALLPKIFVITAILVLRARACFVFEIPREPVIEFAIFPHLLVTLLQRFDAFKVLTVETFLA